ncbi:hypothetical protein BDV37DRAFT_237480 [Aspergillus pseudonomiae]|uniref:Uncharacterized protein n=1 Tax=Aspergillus pseudonomiae TaxID=1506151 RepID=A0A5N7DQY0_9EURO|nr:uncharacterized protein BDV37DRAFT_237480 [Aspergillus pseudonomiae]KAE8408870.1 hypothetical protein BDV37DRAFT_237480 [Aspergillus pseudonomiae]
MSKSQYRDGEDDIPSYEESVRSSTAQRPPYNMRPDVTAPLHRHLDASRVQRVHSLLEQYVDPLLAEQGSSGLYQTTFIFIPSNVTSLHPREKSSYSTPKAPEPVGFPTSTVVKLVQLEGEAHTMEFWRQPAVLRELESSLRARLAASGHHVEGQEGVPTSAKETESLKSNNDNKPKQKKSLWGRLTGNSEAVIVDRKLGWRADDGETPGRKLPRDQVRVIVEWKEVCLRVENDLGLYDNCNAPGICLSVEVGE